MNKTLVINGRSYKYITARWMECEAKWDCQIRHSMYPEQEYRYHYNQSAKKQPWEVYQLINDDQEMREAYIEGCFAQEDAVTAEFGTF